MTSVLLQALFHIGNATPDVSGNTIDVLEDFFQALAENLTSKDESVLGKYRSSQHKMRAHRIRVKHSDGIDNLGRLS